jgi:hypothetical protein
MGDLICAIMALENLNLNPCDFFWVIERRSASWAQYLGLSYFCYDQESVMALACWPAAFEQVINTEQFFGLSQGFALALKRPKGMLTCFSTNRCSRYADLTVEYDWKDAHEVLEFERLFAAALRIPLDASQSNPKSFAGSGSDLPPRQRKRPSQGQAIVCLAGLQSPSRRLNIKRWHELIERWSSSEKGTFLLACAPEDRLFAIELASLLKGKAILFEGSFNELCDRLAVAERLLTMDGGMVHVASYFGVPTTALFTSGRDRKWAPLAKDSRIVKAQGLECQPCTRFGQTPACPYSFKCHELDVSLLDSTRTCQIQSQHRK